jgi:Ca2+-binding EF-hand superfamily protein
MKPGLCAKPWGRARPKWLAALPRARGYALALVFFTTFGIAIGHAFTEEEIRQTFRLFDTNGDGRISPEEFDFNEVSVLFRSDIGNVNDPDRPLRLRYEDTKFSRAYFNELDQNGDGVLTGEEIIGAPSLQFGALDTNGDGFIEYDELAAFMHRVGR